MKIKSKILVVVVIMLTLFASCTTQRKTYNNPQWGIHTKDHYRNGGCGWSK